MTINRILKGLSKATIAVALLGGVATTNSNQPLTVQAAKKKAKKVSKKKAAKKSKKKVTKKSKKKVVKKTTKKKVAKKVTKKKPKKAVKKVVKKPAKKVVKKPSKPKTTVKKSTQKPASTPSQPAKQVVKKTTQADRYTPVISSNTVKLDWGEDLTTYNLSGAISNLDSLPDGITVELQDKNSMSTRHGGTYSVNLVVTYPDGSKDVVGPASYVVATADADKYTPVLKTNSFNLKWDQGWEYTDGEYFATNFTAGWGEDEKNRWLTNEKGYFPNESSNDTYFDVVTDVNGKNEFELPEETGGDYTVYLKTNYPDNSYSISGPVKLHFEPSDAVKYEPKLKQNIRIPASIIGDNDGEALMSYVFENANELPKGTECRGISDYDPGNYEANPVWIEYPDGSRDTIDETVNYQVY